MFAKPDERQRRHEADLIRSYATKLGTTDEGIPVPDTLIEHQPRDMYRPPLFLSRTASLEQVAELEDILHELWTLNEQHVGENTRKVEAYYCVSGEVRPLSERLRRWCHAYFERRADPLRLSPQVHNDPFQQFLKLMQECQSIFGRFIDLEQSLNCFFVNNAVNYVAWLLYERLWKNRVRIMGNLLILDYLPADPFTAEMMAWCMRRGRWLVNEVTVFLSRLRAAAEPHRLREIGRESDSTVRERLAGLVSDIQEMRKFLVRGFNPRKTMVTLGPGLVAAWMWSTNGGVAGLFGGASQVEVEEAMETLRGSLAVRINYEGLFADMDKPWLTVDAASTVEGVSPLVLNYYALEQFHDRLFTFYDRIDFDRIRAGARSRNPEPDLEEEVIALSCQDLAARDTQARAEDESDLRAIGRRIRGVRSHRLLNLLADHFGCEVRQGKGSEVTVYRPGGKKFVLGHHTQNPEVSSVVVGRLLKRLGVGLPQWLDIVYG